jgi:hypothetical protein
LPSQLSKTPLGTIPHNCPPEVFAHNDADSCVRQIRATGYEVKERSGKTTTSLFNAIDIPALPQEEEAVL